MAALAQLQWLRPDWLWALALLPVLGWWWQRRRASASIWTQAVDVHLLPHLLSPGPVSRRWLAPAMAALAFILCVLALAGPSLREVQQPLWAQDSPLVVAVDLSSASLAADTPPSRIARVRVKLASLLAGREGGQVGLVAWAGEAFTVAPLTADTANVALFLDALDPDVMPVDGQRPDRAIARSTQLLAQAGFQDGTILLLSDHATPSAQAEAAKARARGYTVSVLGLGTADGAPYRAAGGEIDVARRDDASLQGLATAGGGRYTALTESDDDLSALGVLDSRRGAGTAGGTESGSSVTTREDDGYWLLLPVMLLALLAFRRGAPVLLLVICLWLPGRDAFAAELWQRPDQRAHRTMQDAEAAYRRGDFDQAAKLYGDVDGADAHYNRGNALARQGRYADAIAAYDEALKVAPDMEDAVANRRAVEAAMNRKPPPGQKSSPGASGAPNDDADSGSGDPSSDAERGDDQKKKENAEQGNDDGAGEGRGGNAPAAEEDQGQPPRPGSDSEEPAGESAESEAADAEAQAAADAAQRERMREALDNARENGESDGGAAAEATPESAEQREQRIANEAWLRRIPDDPGGLLRRKFRIEYERRQREGSTD
ncbi:tetratricopeptide repeat protein [Lysobacter sp. A03]|uniref:tetratricopeptide repeat protein n=1 Tax=Lysobacter sp. A03 TaxID=1199154 RepID=UPI0005B6B571|nr:tetratricopeptide repeat protein [Lysobacter sp. A03]KIQ97780.1 TPR domain protein in aerotolerance operon [Lysobacter sp. A03]